MKYIDVKSINCRYPKNMYAFIINDRILLDEKFENFTDEENFILFSGEGKRVEDIITEFEDKFNTNSYFSMKVIWDTLHMFYFKGIIKWKEHNPFQDFYEYECKDTKINIMLPWEADKYKEKEEEEALHNVISKYSNNNLSEKISSEFSDNTLFVKTSKGEKTLIRVVFTPYEKEYSYIIKLIGIYSEEVTPKLLENTFIWASSKLSIIFNNFCRTFELRVNEESLDTLEIKKLLEIDFKVDSYFEGSEKRYIVSKTI